MKWPSAYSVVPTRQSNTAGPDFFLPCLPISEDGSAFAPLMWPMERPNSPPPLEPLLHQRALRLRNREPKAVAQYMQVHMNLSKGR